VEISTGGSYFFGTGGYFVVHSCSQVRSPTFVDGAFGKMISGEDGTSVAATVGAAVAAASSTTAVGASGVGVRAGAQEARTSPVDAKAPARKKLRRDIFFIICYSPFEN
jgi:hypothetical protein